MKHIEILKKGLTKLQNKIEDRKTRIEGKLRAHQPISDSDQEWLDNDRNLVDEEQVVMIALDHAQIGAALMLREHVATLNDPYTCKFEVMLGSFGQQMHMQSMMDTKITNYFVRK